MAASTTEKKPGIIERINRTVRDMYGEMKRVVWPSRKQTLNNTAIVIVFMLVMALIIGVFDTALSALIRAVFSV